MNELDDEMRTMLSAARRALSPTPADEARVLERTLRAASVPVAGSLLLKLVLALSIAGVSGSIGYVLGRQDREVRVVQVVAPAKPEPKIVEPEPPESVEIVAPAPKVEPRPRARKSTPSVSAPVVALAEVQDAESPLEVEVRIMQAVERALRDNDPGLALRRLDQLDGEVPQGSLMEERSAASVMARCRLGLGNRAKLIEEFSAQYAKSAYEVRVRNSCATKTDSPR